MLIVGINSRRKTNVAHGWGSVFLAFTDIIRKITPDRMFSKSVNPEVPELPFCRNDDYANDLEDFDLKRSSTAQQEPNLLTRIKAMMKYVI